MTITAYEGTRSKTLNETLRCTSTSKIIKTRTGRGEGTKAESKRRKVPE